MEPWPVMGGSQSREGLAGPAVHVNAAQGSASGGALPQVGLCLGGRRQGRLTPGGLRALAPLGLWALTGWESFTSITSNQYWGCGFIWSCQKTTIVASQ